jgi:hypothetical protein
MDEAEARAGAVASEARRPAPTSWRFVGAIGAGWVALFVTCAIIYAAIYLFFDQPSNVAEFLTSFEHDVLSTLWDFIKEAGAPALAISAAFGFGIHYVLSQRGWDRRNGAYAIAGVLVGALGMSAVVFRDAVPYDLGLLPLAALVGALLGAVFASAFGSVMRRA